MALCCYDLQTYDEFLKYLKKACERNPKECNSCWDTCFPRGGGARRLLQVYQKENEKMKPINWITCLAT